MILSDSIPDWRDFYLTVGAASATLVGLLYVAVALTPEVIADESRDDLRSLARATFGNFLNVFVLSLTVLLPWSSLWPLGAAVAGWASLGMVRSAFALRKALGENEPAFERAVIIRRVGVPVASQGLVVITGLTLIAGSAAWFWLIAVDVFVALTQAAFGTWDLLGLIGQAKQDEGSDKSAAPQPNRGRGEVSEPVDPDVRSTGRRVSSIRGR